MSRTHLNKDGFTLVETLLVVLTLAIIGVSGYFVAKHVDKQTLIAKSNTTASTAQSTNATTVLPYTSYKSACPSIQSSTTVPSGWQTFNNSMYKYSFSYPSSWSVVSSAVTSTNQPILDDMLVDPPDNDGIGIYEIYVNPQTINDALTTFEDNLKAYNSSEKISGETRTIKSNTSCTFDNYPAAEVIMEINDGPTVGIEYDIELYVSAHDNVYDFSVPSSSLDYLANSSNPSVGDILSVINTFNIK